MKLNYRNGQTVNRTIRVAAQVQQPALPGGLLRVQVTATGESSALAGIMRLVRDAQQSRSRTQLPADKAAGGCSTSR